MASAEVFRQFLQAPKSMMDYSAEYDRADANKLALLAARQQLEAGQFEAQTKRQGFEQGQRRQNKLATLYADQSMRSNPTALEDALLSDPLTAADGLAARKSRIDAENTQAQTRKSGADADASSYKLRIDKANQALKDVAAFQSPMQALADLQAKAQAGQLPPEHAQALAQQLQAIQNPQQWAEWQRQTRYRMLDAKDQLEQEWKAKAEARAAANDAATNANRPLIAGPGGQFVPNVPLQQFEKDKAKAGAAVTTVNMADGQKGFDNEVKLRNDFKSEPIYKAHQEMQSAYGQIGQALKQASPSGDLAAATKIMKLLDPGSVVRESELGMAMAANGLQDRLMAIVPNIINGTKLTPQQRVQFQQLADALMSTSVEQFNAKHGEYMKLGGDYGLNAGRALGATAKPAGTAAKKPASSAAPASGAGKVINFGDLQ